MLAVSHFEKFIDKLELTDNGFSDAELGAFIQRIAEQSKLSALKLCRNPIGQATVHGLAKLLTKPLPNHLERLELNDCRIQ